MLRCTGVFQNSSCWKGYQTCGNLVKHREVDLTRLWGDPPGQLGPPGSFELPELSTPNLQQFVNLEESVTRGGDDVGPGGGAGPQSQAGGQPVLLGHRSPGRAGQWQSRLLSVTGRHRAQALRWLEPGWAESCKAPPGTEPHVMESGSHWTGENWPLSVSAIG